jgi:hypothetical protein
MCAECLNKHFEVEYGVGLSDKHKKWKLKLGFDKHYEECI